MTADQYKTERKLRGTQIQVAALLGVDRMTIVRREGGDITITREAEIALLSLPVKIADGSSTPTSQSPRRG